MTEVDGMLVLVVRATDGVEDWYLSLSLDGQVVMLSQVRDLSAKPRLGVEEVVCARMLHLVFCFLSRTTSHQSSCSALLIAALTVA